MTDEDDEIKVILIGETGTGKTCLINTCVGLAFNEDNLSTVASTYSTKKYKINDQEYTVNLWDTAGQEQYRSLNKIFIKHSKIVILVYSIVVKKSFIELEYWYNTIKEILGDEAIMGVVGNKKDLYLDEEVSEEEGKKFAQSKNMSFQLVSAKECPADFIDFLQTLLEQYLVKNGLISNEDKKEKDKKDKKDKKAKKEKNINLKDGIKKDKNDVNGKCC